MKNLVLALFLISSSAQSATLNVVVEDVLDLATTSVAYNAGFNLDQFSDGVSEFRVWNGSDLNDDFALKITLQVKPGFDKDYAVWFKKELYSKNVLVALVASKKFIINPNEKVKVEDKGAGNSVFIRQTNTISLTP